MFKVQVLYWGFPRLRLPFLLEAKPTVPAYAAH